MNLKSLIMESMYEAEDPQRAAYDKFKADDAKAVAIEQVKKYASIPLNAIPRLANAIDPKTGIIYYGEPGRGGGDSSPRMMPFQFVSQPDQKPMVDALTLAGLKVVPHEVKQLFGTSQYAKVEPVALQQVLTGSGVAPQAAAQADPAAPATPPAAVAQSVAEPVATPTNTMTREKLAALLDKLEKGNGGSAANPANPAKPAQQLLPVDPNIKAFQAEVLKTDPNAFPKFGADGRKGAEVIRAIAKYPEIAKKYKLVPQGANPASAPVKSSDLPGSIMGASDPMTGMPYNPMPESVYKEDQALARIVQLARG